MNKERRLYEIQTERAVYVNIKNWGMSDMSNEDKNRLLDRIEGLNWEQASLTENWSDRKMTYFDKYPETETMEVKINE